MNTSDIPIFEIQVPNYNIIEPIHFSGECAYTEFGNPVPVEYWDAMPDFSAISIPIIQFLRERHALQRIGLRMLGSMKHPGKKKEEVIELIKKLGHDRYDPQREDNKYGKIDTPRTELFMLEIQVGKELGLDGEEQIHHALHSFYCYPESPVRVDIGIIYDLSAFVKEKIVFDGKEELAHLFKSADNKSAAILGILNII